MSWLIRSNLRTSKLQSSAKAPHLRTSRSDNQSNLGSHCGSAEGENSFRITDGPVLIVHVKDINSNF